MEKIKTSELFEKMVIATQKAFISEDNNIINIISNHLGNKTENFDLKDIITIINANNEFCRASYIKAVCDVLAEYGIVEKDVDLNNIDISNKLLQSAIHKAVTDM